MDFLYSIYDWVKETFLWLGWGNLEANIILLGIDNAGKTTLLHLLKYGSLKQSPPTRKPTMEELQIEGISFKAYDLGGVKLFSLVSLFQEMLERDLCGLLTLFY